MLGYGVRSHNQRDISRTSSEEGHLYHTTTHTHTFIQLLEIYLLIYENWNTKRTEKLSPKKLHISLQLFLFFTLFFCHSPPVIEDSFTYIIIVSLLFKLEPWSRHPLHFTHVQSLLILSTFVRPSSCLFCSLLSISTTNCGYYFRQVIRL